MRHTIAIAGAISFSLISVSSSIAGECSYAAGDAALFRTPSDVVAALSASAITKGEFETTAEYEARKASATGEVSSRYLVLTDYDPEFAVYDADREVFDISRFAWSNIVGSFDKVFPEVGIIDDVYGFGLHVESQSMGSYQASNSFGATVTVVKTSRTRYGIYGGLNKSGSLLWAYDFAESGSYSNDTFRAEGVTVPVPRSVAPQVKDGMIIGVEYAPQSPFLAEGSDYWEPTMKRPEEIVEQVVSLVGDIECLVIVGPDNIVLRAVPSAY
jgi:hypothetical protein